MPVGHRPRPRRNARPVRVYLNGGRYWGDFRKYHDVGGKREPLKAAGARLATDDPIIARRVADARQAEYEAARPHSSSPAVSSLRGAAEAFLKERMKSAQDAKADKKTRVIRFNEFVKMLQVVVQHLEALGYLHLKQVDRAAVTRLADLLKAGREGRKPVSASTVRKQLMALSAMLKNRLGHGLIDSNPVNGHPAVPSVGNAPPIQGIDPKPKDRHLPPWDVQLLITELEARALETNHPRGPRSALALVVLVYFGLRLREALGLEWRDIVPPPNTKTPGQIIVARKTRRDLKNSTSHRQVPLWPALWTILDKAARKQGISRGPDDLVVPGQQGNMMSRVDGVLTSALQRAGLPHLTPHALRHTYATARLRCTTVDPTGRRIAASEDLVARELGHASTKEVRERYGHHDGRPDFQLGLLLDYREAWQLVYGSRKRLKSAGVAAGSTRSAREMPSPPTKRAPRRKRQ